jgi:hypothetical protein
VHCRNERGIGAHDNGKQEENAQNDPDHVRVIGHSNLLEVLEEGIAFSTGALGENIDVSKERLVVAPFENAFNDSKLVLGACEID